MSRSLLHVNLIAREIAQARRDALWRRLCFAVIVVFALLLGAAHVGVSRRVSYLKSQEARLAKQISRFQPDAQRRQELEKRHRELTAHASLVRSSRHTEKQWQRLLSDLTGKLPEDAWLTEIRTVEAPSRSGSLSDGPGDAGQTVSVAGVSKSAEGVSKYLTRLNYTDWFAAELQLQKMRRKRIGDEPVFEFTATGRLRKRIGSAGEAK